ncbi:hypothetical protein BHM03_00009336 [Ensete ventricosum]|uniref:Uncharacterized protein n=1 Tax=Ensete ventricosum TaxID=4639 RepID=A0A445MCQ4_ENSVE|nr:hypothetical protein BHM03_00009336 [Ensete ventricosum]
MERCKAALRWTSAMRPLHARQRFAHRPKNGSGLGGQSSAPSLGPRPEAPGGRIPGRCSTYHHRLGPHRAKFLHGREATWALGLFCQLNDFFGWLLPFCLILLGVDPRPSPWEEAPFYTLLAIHFFLFVDVFSLGICTGWLAGRLENPPFILNKLTMFAMTKQESLDFEQMHQVALTARQAPTKDEVVPAMAPPPQAIKSSPELLAHFRHTDGIPTRGANEEITFKSLNKPRQSSDLA